MKPLDPRLLRLSRTARGAVAASAATGLVRTLATVAIAWGIATAVTLGVDGVRDRVLPAALTPTLALLGAAFVVRAVAAWATEAPRGLLFHRYEVDARGRISAARIVPPTSQNQVAIEADLVAFAPSVLALPHDQATVRLEQLIRSYDPCISCATHFLDLQIEGR